MKKLYLIFLVLFMINLASAATIYGDIYDWDLKPIKNVQLIIDSTPKQNLISTTGSYSFELPPGTYNLEAYYKVDNEIIASSIDEINIQEEGSYRYDVILFPEFENDIEDINVDEISLEDNSNQYYLFLLIIILFAAVIFIYSKKKKKPKIDEKDESHKVLELINKNKRITQKEIRKALGLSEAKLSLIISELQHKNKIEKIKKGRGNIIILKK